MTRIKTKRYALYLGDCLEVLRTLPENCVHAVVTDPPYHLTTTVKRFGKPNSAPAKEGTDGRFARASAGFMGQEWDGGDVSFRPETWAEVLRVLKPGGHLLSFAGTRTHHRIACAIEDAGFEIRDTISWVYATGFPKNHDAVRSITQHDKGETENAMKWQGFGSALKPATEPITLARKPLEGTLAANCLKWGTGFLNIDASRIPYEGEVPNVGGRGKHGRGEGYGFKPMGDDLEANAYGRWPANMIHDGSDEVVAGFPAKSGGAAKAGKGSKSGGIWSPSTGKPAGPTHADSGSAARFFFCAKPSAKEKEAGLDDFEAESMGFSNGAQTQGEGYNKGQDIDLNRVIKRKNIHPTIKPITLMRYLCRLITPPNGIVLDPFMGSASTGCGALEEGFRFIGIEKDEKYFSIAAARVKHTVDHE